MLSTVVSKRALTLKVPVTTAADDIIFCCHFSEKIRLAISCELFAWADDSHEMSALFFFLKNK